jgi:hypothetical protein
LNIELAIISTDNVRKLCELELKDILIQQDFNFIGKEPNYYTRKELTIELLTISTDNIWEKSLKIPKG